VQLTHGTLLGGKVSYAQPASGFRNGIEPVLLAASVKALPGQRVLEAGTGAGAALLCLASRVGDLACTGVERDAGLAGLARENAAANAVRAEILLMDVMAGLPRNGFDHALANPPWHSEISTSSPDPARDGAKRGRFGLIAAWAGVLAAALRPGGTLTFILPASAIGEAFAAFAAAGCGGLTLAPLWPKAGCPAKIILLHAVRQSRSASRVLPGLVLHEKSGAYTVQAEAILRGGCVWAFEHPKAGD
jgi:tRNA1Val (adenine37-N6)-methyltransferase